MEAAIEVEKLRKAYQAGEPVLDGLTFQVGPGEVYGLVGRNGTGKSTALRIVMGLLHPNGGSARVLGRELWDAPRAHRARVAYVAQEQVLHEAMTLAEHARYLAHLYPRWDDGLARSLAETLELPWERATGALSGGQRRLAGLVLALAAQPEVLVLDEPGAGLDPIARRRVLDAVIDALAAAEPMAVLLSTHILVDLERLADRVGFVDAGRIVLDEELATLQREMRRVHVACGDVAQASDLAIPGALSTTRQGAFVTALAQIADDAALDPIRRLPGARVQVEPLDLEEVFVAVLGAS